MAGTIRDQIEFDRLRREDLPQLSELIAGMRREGDATLRIRDSTPAYYDWMYFQNPAGPAIVFVGRHEGRVVTSFAMAPKRIQFGDDVVLCGKTMDMFTHPQYQGLGLIGAVTSRVFDEARARGIRMWYVTPSVNSYPIFRDKWGYVESVRVHTVVRLLDPAATFRTVARPRMLGRAGGAVLARFPARRIRQSPSFDVRAEHTFDTEVDDLWRRCDGSGVALVRDSAYLTWRYLANPDSYDVDSFSRDGELRGILVTKLTKRRGLPVGELVDVVAAPADVEVRDAMLGHALRQFRRRSCAVAQSWAIAGSGWETQLRSHGIGRPRRKLPFLLSPDAPRPEFYDPDAWFLTQGDGNDV